jgi:conjugative transfer pilus assembly protein TraH
MFKILKLILLVCCTVFSNQAVAAFGLKDVYKNLHVNTTSPGNYQDAAAGYYSGGSSVIRTKNTAIDPFSISPPSFSSGCNGIDAFIGSFSMMSGGELVSIASNIGSQAVVYGFHLGMKTYAPQIEQVLKDLRNLSMELNQLGIANCKTVQAGFAAALPQNSAMYETVCEEMANSNGSVDLGGQRKKCKDRPKQNAEIEKKQAQDPEILINNYNLFVKAATAVGIPGEMHAQLMSMTGTIIVKDRKVIPYPSLASDPDSWNTHINGGDGASVYSCDNAACLNITVNNNVTISTEESYAGKARLELDKLKIKIKGQTDELNAEEKGFLDSIGQSFPIFDHITLEAATNISILNSDSQIIARYMLMSHLTKVTADIKKGVLFLKDKQPDKLIKGYEYSLNDLMKFAKNEWDKVMSDADRINDRAEKIEKHVMARERS